MTEDDRFYITEARRLAALDGITDYGLAFGQARITLGRLASIAERLDAELADRLEGRAAAQATEDNHG